MNKKGPTKRCFFVRPNSFGCSNARSLTPKPEGRNRRRFAYRPRRRRRSGNLRHQEKSAKRRHRNGQKTAVFQHSKPIAKRFQPKTLAAPTIAGAAYLLHKMAPQVGLEPTTLRLTAGCSAIELLRSGGWPGGQIISIIASCPSS